MAAISRGVVERENTIEENRKRLNELMINNEFIEPSQKELDKLFKRLNHHNARNIIKDMKHYEPAWHDNKVTDRQYGPIAGIPSGSWWGIRMDCSRDRMHDPFSASVQPGPFGAISICTSHSNEDIDLGDSLTFTCQPHDDEGDAIIVGDKKLSQESRSLILNFENRVPVRIIRSYDLLNEYSPKTGYRYDGLYMVVDYWVANSSHDDTTCYKFALRRLYNQEPPPWKSQTSYNNLTPVPALKRYSKNSNLQDQGGTICKINNTNANNNDTIISRCISRKRVQRRDGNTPKVVKSDSEALQSSLSGVQEPMKFTQAESGCKIPSTDQKNVKVSTIVSRRVSRKLSNNIIDNKFMTDCGSVRLWNTIGCNESQMIEDEEGLKFQNTRLQNTNISIRTDLYDSSHNLKQNLKKCGSSVTHGNSNFKRVLGLPRRELHFAGVDSSPGSSRTISSVKMERIKGSVDNQINKRNLNHSYCEEKNKAPYPKPENERFSPVLKIISSTVDCSHMNFEQAETPRSRFSYSCHTQEDEEFREADLIDEEGDGQGSACLQSELRNIEDKSSLGHSLPSSPPFKGFLPTDKSITGVEVSWTEPTVILNSLSLEKMLDIIKEDKSSPMAKLLISNVIGFPVVESPEVFKEATQSDTQIQETLKDNKLPNSDPKINNNRISEAENKQSSIGTRLCGDATAHTETSENSSINNSQNLRKSKFRRLENSGQQAIIEVVYDGKEDNDSVQDNSDYTIPKDDLTIVNGGGIGREDEHKLTSASGSVLDQTESSNKNIVIRQYDSSQPSNTAEYTVQECNGEHESQIEVQCKEKSVFLRVQGHQQLNEGSSEPSEKKARVARMEDNVESCDNIKNSQSGLVTIKSSKLWKQNNARENFSKSAASEISNKKCMAQIITRSKYQQNTIVSSQKSSSSSVDTSLRLDVENNKNIECDQGAEIMHCDKPRSLKRVQQSRKSVVVEPPKAKSPEKMRIIKRSGVRPKRKMEIANLFIDMNMSPRSQVSKSKLRSKRSLRDSNQLRRRSCPAVVNRSLKRRNDDTENNSASPLKRMKKVVQSSKSSVQEKGLSLRDKGKKQNLLSNNNNNNNNIPGKRVGKAEKVITNIKKSMKSTARNLIKNKNKNVNGIRKPAEIPKRRETSDKNCSDRSLRSITVGRIGLRRALLTGTEAYARKKKKKKEKQKLTSEKATKPAKQRAPKKKVIEFALNKAKLNYQIYKGTRAEEQTKKPKMVDVMTQCSLIAEPPPRYSAILGTRRSRRTDESNLCTTSDNSSECVRDSGEDQMKHEIIELIDLKSEPFDDDVVPCDEEDIQAKQKRIQTKQNSVFNYHSTRLKTGQTISNAYNEIQSHARSPSQPFNDLRSFDAAPRRGFIRYVAGPRVSAFVPVKSVDSNLIITQLKSIGFKPIKPGLFPSDGFTDYAEQTSSDTPRIAYSSAVVKRGVHEEYDKYTSEENNVVQYMDSKLCYEDIENEDIIHGIHNEQSLSDLFVEKMEFGKLRSEELEEEEEEAEEEEEEGVEEEDEEDSKDNSICLRDGDEENEESSSKGNLRPWQSQMDDNSLNSEHPDQGVIDSDSDMPWHGWRKIISNKETHFVGW